MAVRPYGRSAVKPYGCLGWGRGDAWRNVIQVLHRPAVLVARHGDPRREVHDDETVARLLPKTEGVAKLVDDGAPHAGGELRRRCPHDQDAELHVDRLRQRTARAVGDPSRGTIAGIG